MSYIVRTAVIPVAGLATRFLPISMSIPKEMLPLLDRPMIEYSIREAVDSGIENIIFITSNHNHILQNYLKKKIETKVRPDNKSNLELSSPQEQLSEIAQFTFIPQRKPLGLGHAILQAKKAIGNNPFAVLLPDDLILSKKPVLASMLATYQQREASYVAIHKVAAEDVSSYGIIKGEPVNDFVYNVEGIVEKPLVNQAPSLLGVVGRYIFDPDIFSCLEQTNPGALGEIQLTDGISLLLEQKPVNAYLFEGTRFDCGNPIGLLQASLELALRRKDAKATVRKLINQIKTR
jgi:UTP--glucose-1-phosphate uridylyltransferase